MKLTVRQFLDNRYSLGKLMMIGLLGHATTPRSQQQQETGAVKMAIGRRSACTWCFVLTSDTVGQSCGQVCRDLSVVVALPADKWG